jgi:ADP-ribosylglycohydrolase
MTDVVRSAAAQIPSTSRLYERVMDIISRYENSESAESVFEYIHTLYDENNGHDWCHTISNAMIVVAALLYGEGNFGKSVCMAVQTGFDTDCNGATVGSVVGMMYGLSAIGEEWSGPMRDTLYTSVFGVGKVKISDRVEMTMKHIK